MKRKLFAILLLAATLLSVLPGISLSADTIDESKILGMDALDACNVPLGTPLADLQKLLPDSVTLRMEKDSADEGTVLHEAMMEQNGWTLYDKSAIAFSDGKLCVKSASTKVKAVSGGEYTDFVLETTLRGTAAANNNFGVMLRASDVTEKTADSYNGYYVGIGKNGSKNALVIGYADGKWHLLKDVVIDYKPNTDYALKVLMHGNTLAVWLDGKLLYKDELTLFEKGSVGIRTYKQLFECSSFTVRTPSKAELTQAGVSAFELKDAAVDAWKCENYDPDTTGGYLFSTTVSGTNYGVTCLVNVVTELELLNEQLEALSYENVDITSDFFGEYIKQMVCKVVPTAIANVEKPTGGMPNIKNAAKKNRGESYSAFAGAYYVDSDVHKVLESMCYALSVDPMGDSEIISAQVSIKAKLEEWIPYFVDAQEESGYFATYYTLDPAKVKFSDVSRHELYCMGHFMEAAIAHYEYSDGNDTRLLDVAVKCADYLYKTFGDEAGKRKQIAGHQEIELALLKLAKTALSAGDAYSEKAHTYAELAAFFLSVRGDYEDRTVEGTLEKEYWQDHAKVEDQTEAVGHAVRAQYMYTAMAELAAIDEEYREKYDNALTSLWNDVTHTKQYVTGGVGQTSYHERFLDSYYLPNDTAYCETCAGIANMMWNRSMSQLYAGSAFADQLETDLYNAVLGCVNLDGDKFYYVNSLQSQALRNAWYGTACCPPNLTRTILSLGGYIYNYNEDSLYINQYISNAASVPFGAGEVRVNMTSEMPWSGNGSIVLSMQKDTKLNLYLRMPGWSDKAEIKVNGKIVSVSADKNGYIVLSDTFSDGDRIAFEFSMPVLFEETCDLVEMNIGYVSLRRGPIVYCAEYADNGFDVRHAYVDVNSEIKVEKVENLDGKADPYGVRDMNILKVNGYLDGLKGNTAVEWTFIPFYARLNREQGMMSVYVAKESIEKPLAEYATPSASHTYSGDSPDFLKDGSDDTENRWTSWKDGTVLKNPWVQYDFDGEVLLSGCNIWWYDDGGGVQLADGFEIYYKNEETAEFTPVSHDEKYLCENADGLITYTFDEVAVSSLRIVIENSKAAAGIVEWELIGSKITPEEDAVDPPVDPSVEPGDDEDKDDGAVQNKEDGGFPVWVFAVIAVVVLAIGAGALIWVKKKK